MASVSYLWLARSEEQAVRVTAFDSTDAVKTQTDAGQSSDKLCVHRARTPGLSGAVGQAGRVCRGGYVRGQLEQSGRERQQVLASLTRSAWYSL